MGGGGGGGLESQGKPSKLCRAFLDCKSESNYELACNIANNWQCCRDIFGHAPHLTHKSWRHQFLSVEIFMTTKSNTKMAKMNTPQKLRTGMQYSIIVEHPSMLHVATI